MKQKKVCKGFIPKEVLEKVHIPEDFIGINIRTDIRTIRDNLKREKEERGRLREYSIKKKGKK